jgi:phosphate transport system substrate-binding protein
MRKKLMLASFAPVVSFAIVAHAAPAQFRGSDTLFGAVTDAINQLGLENELAYLGGGSGLGETAVSQGAQGIAPMSRAPTAQAIAAAAARGITLTPNVVGLDGVSLFVKASESVKQADIPTLRNVFAGADGTGSSEACAAPARIKDWSAFPGSGKRGPLTAFRRNDDSGTTDAFKNLVGIKAFCSDVVIKASTADIAAETSTNPGAIGYAGASATREGQNRALAIAATAAGPYVVPGEDTVRDFTYPLARRLYLVVASGAHAPSAAEQTLLDNLLDRSFFDPILTANDFVTCAESGCP